MARTRKGHVPKTDAAEIERRITAVYEMIIQGKRRGSIVRFAAETWGVGSRQTETYIARARAIMVADLEVERDKLLGQAIAQRNDLYRRSHEKEKYWHCLEIAKDREQLLGLYFNTEDHIKAVQAAGYEVRPKGTDSPDDSDMADRAAEDFFPADDSDQQPASDPDEGL